MRNEFLDKATSVNAIETPEHVYEAIDVAFAARLNTRKDALWMNCECYAYAVQEPIQKEDDIALWKATVWKAYSLRTCNGK